MSDTTPERAEPVEDTPDRPLADVLEEFWRSQEQIEHQVPGHFTGHLLAALHDAGFKVVRRG